jgi:hypothetical protein
MRFSLIGAVFSALFVCNVAEAQVEGADTPTSTISATSTLGIEMGSPGSPTVGELQPLSFSTLSQLVSGGVMLR